MAKSPLSTDLTMLAGLLQREGPALLELLLASTNYQAVTPKKGMLPAPAPTAAQQAAVERYVRKYHAGLNPAGFLALVQKILSIGGPFLQLILMLFGGVTPTPVPVPVPTPVPAKSK